MAIKCGKCGMIYISPTEFIHNVKHVDVDDWLCSTCAKRMVICIHCGTSVDIDPQKPEVAYKELTEHEINCDKNPLVIENTELKEVLKKVKNISPIHTSTGWDYQSAYNKCILIASETLKR